MTAPPILLAALSKLVASPQLTAAIEAGQVAEMPSNPPMNTTLPAVMIGTNSDGLPFYLGDSAASITLRLGREWTRSATTARFPRLYFDVWAPGDVGTGTGEWLAREVADTIVSVFDCTAGPNELWSDVFVISSKYCADLMCAEVEGQRGLYRAELGFEIQTA